MTYWIKELVAPDGYQNDPATALGYPVTIAAHGGSNESAPVLFENTPELQKITIIKYIDDTFVGDIGDGTLLDGLEF